MKLLMKAAALPFLIENRSSYLTPAHVVSGYFEGFCKSLHVRRSELLAAIQNASHSEVLRSIQTICEDRSTREYFPRVTQEFMVDLWAVGGPKLVQQVAEVFTAKPYEYRAGWPDLTMLSEGRVQFREVKTTDLLLPSQLRFATELARPLGLQCAVVHVTWESCLI